MVVYIMSDVINLTDYIEKKKTIENKVLSDLDLIQLASETVLDSIDYNFDEGILIGTLNNKLQLSSTMDDEETLQMLEEALENLYQELNYD
jgi:hypothetical protein